MKHWVQPGSKLKVPHLGKHLRRNIMGAVYAHSGEFFSLMFDGVAVTCSNAGWMNWQAQSRQG